MYQALLHVRRKSQQTIVQVLVNAYQIHLKKKQSSSHVYDII